MYAKRPRRKSSRMGRNCCYFNGCSEYVALFTCTAGYEVEKWSNIYKEEGDLVMSYVIDATGSLLVEGAMDIVYDKLKVLTAFNDLSITNRYSPGYCEWQVADQQKLFTFLPNDFCNISLSQSSLMSPIKWALVNTSYFEAISVIHATAKIVSIAPRRCMLNTKAQFFYLHSETYYKGCFLS